jgi:hypothetical protein
MAAPTKGTLIEKEPEEAPGAHEVKVLFTWKAPVRMFKKRDREFWTTALAIAFLVGLILLLIKEWLLIMVIISILFFYYISSTVSPEEAEYQITNQGIRVGSRNFLWGEIGCFWFTEKWDQKILNLLVPAEFVKHIQLIIPIGKEKEIETTLKKFLPEETPPLTFMDKAANWLSQKVPLEIS